MSQKKLNRFKYIEAFSAVMSTGSVSAAALRLGVSQPAVSQLIKKFENAVGVPLFIRKNGVIYPTARAENLRDDVEDLLNQLDKIQMQLNFGGAKTMSSVRFSASISLTNEVLPNLLHEMHKQKPKTSFYVSSLPRVSMIRAILEGSVDFALTNRALGHSSIICRHLMAAKEVCVMPITHPLAKKSKLKLKDLNNQKILMTSRTDPSYDYHRELLHKNGVRYQKLLESPMTSMSLSMVDSFNALSINNALMAELVCSRDPCLTWRCLDGVDRSTDFFLCMPPWLSESSTESLVADSFYQSLDEVINKLDLNGLLLRVKNGISKNNSA